MTELRVGEEITVVDNGEHGPRTYRWGTEDLLKAQVIKVVGTTWFRWRADDEMTGTAWRRDEGSTWMRGQNAEVWRALSAARRLVNR